MPGAAPSLIIIIGHVDIGDGRIARPRRRGGDADFVPDLQAGLRRPGEHEADSANGDAVIGDRGHFGLDLDRHRDAHGRVATGA